MGVILVLVLILLIWRGGKKKQKKRRRRTYTGKSDWEKMCDEGGKLYGWKIISILVFLWFITFFFVTL